MGWWIWGGVRGRYKERSMAGFHLGGKLSERAVAYDAWYTCFMQSSIFFFKNHKLRMHLYRFHSCKFLLEGGRESSGVREKASLCPSIPLR